MEYFLFPVKLLSGQYGVWRRKILTAEIVDWLTSVCSLVASPVGSLAGPGPSLGKGSSEKALRAQ